MSQILKEISTWRQEAAKEKNPNYFFVREDFPDLLDGGKFIISGRKGSGKTATLKYIDAYCREKNHPHNALSARDLDFHSLHEVSKNPAQAEGP